MTSRDFCYLLQGLFEIGFAQPRFHEIKIRVILSTLQLELIRAHLKMVLLAKRPSHPTKAMEFCLWLDEAFPVLQAGEAGETAIALVQERLNEVFFHEIDPSFPAEDQEQLSHIHNPFSEFSDGIRC